MGIIVTFFQTIALLFILAILGAVAGTLYLIEQLTLIPSATWIQVAYGAGVVLFVLYMYDIYQWANREDK